MHFSEYLTGEPNEPQTPCRRSRWNEVELKKAKLRRSHDSRFRILFSLSSTVNRREDEKYLENYFQFIPNRVADKTWILVFPSAKEKLGNIKLNDKKFFLRENSSARPKFTFPFLLWFRLATCNWRTLLTVRWDISNNPVRKIQKKGS